MPAAAAIPWLGTAIAGAAGATGAVVAGHMQSSAAKDAAKLQTDAANHGADVQDAATQRAEAFQRQQAEQQWQEGERLQRANYDQAKSRTSALANLGSSLGMNVNIPDYVPGTDPRFTDAIGVTSTTKGTPPPVSPSGAPSSGNFSDPAYAAQFVQHYASQPGANPSLARDPNYWIGKITSGELGADPKYIVSKFMLPEGAPAGAKAPTGGTFGSLVAPRMAPIAPMATPTTPLPTPYQPGTIGAYVNGRIR